MRQVIESAQNHNELKKKSLFSWNLPFSWERLTINNRILIVLNILQVFFPPRVKSSAYKVFSP